MREDEGSLVPDNDNKPDALIETLLTPEAISARVQASTGVLITPRTIWDKARRVGVSRKIGRSQLISSRDIPALFIEEKKKKRRRMSGASL